MLMARRSKRNKDLMRTLIMHQADIFISLYLNATNDKERARELFSIIEDFVASRQVELFESLRDAKLF